MTPRRRYARAPLTPTIQMHNDGAMMLYLPEPPSANRWWRHWRGRMVLSVAARTYKRVVATLAEGSRITPFLKPTPVRVAMHWHRGRKSGDLDKRLGVLLDALQGVAYENDSQIVEISARRDDTPGAHAVVVHVWPLHQEPMEAA